MGEYAHGFSAIKKNARSIALVSALTFIATGVFWLGPKLLSSEKAFDSGSKTVGAGSAALAQEAAGGEDTDADGLKDWEEALWRTDPLKADSDADGAPDGEEVGIGRDPLKPGPNDRMPQPAEERSSGEPASGGLTYNLTRRLLESGVLGAIGPDGRLASTEFLRNFNLPKDINPDALLASATSVTERDLAGLGRSDAAAVRGYFNALYTVYEREFLPHQGRGDLAVLADALQSGNYAKLVELDPLILALGRSAEAIRRIPVPAGWERFAVAEINFVLKTKRAVEIFRNTPADPLATMVVVRRRLGLLQEMAKLHADAKAELDAQGIAFASSEGGFAYFR